MGSNTEVVRTGMKLQVDLKLKLRLNITLPNIAIPSWWGNTAPYEITVSKLACTILHHFSLSLHKC